MIPPRAFGLLAGLLAAGCDARPNAEAEEPPDYLYVGAATDEALSRLLDATPRDDAAHRLVVDAPPAGTALARDIPATIGFHPPGQTAFNQRGRPRPASLSMLAELVALVGPIRTAHAHGTPFNGTGFLLVFADHAGRIRLRVFTDRTSYTPPATTWAELVDAPPPLSLTLTWAAFEQNTIPDGSGPFVGGSFSLGHP